MKVDIVGGSISGLSSAISLKEHDSNIKVVVYEKYKKIGYNHEGRRCGEAHTVESEWSKWKPAEKSYFNMITIGKTIIGNRQYIFPREINTSYILNRQEFICQLAEKAEKLGAIIQTGEKIKTIDDLNSDYIIDASGCPSSIKKELGFKNRIIGVTYQQTLEDSNCFVPDTVKIVFSGDCGYFWIFPRNPRKKEINIGAGFFGDFHGQLKEVLEAFKEEQKIEGKINYVTGGYIPLGLQQPLGYKNILFVGDAGVGTFPFTGQGIYRALISGDVAGICIAQNNPKKYPYLMKQKFIKWDVFGKKYIRMNNVLRRVNPKLVLKMFQFMANMSGMSH